MIETRAGGAFAVRVDFRDLRKAGNAAVHARNGVVVIPADEIHAARFDLGSYVADDVELAVVRRTKILEDRVPKIFLIVVVEGAAGKSRWTRFAMVRQRDGAVRRHAGFREIVRVGPDRVDSALLLQVVQQRVDALIDPRVRLHLDSDVVFAV